jgi:hypothetical protein
VDLGNLSTLPRGIVREGATLAQLAVILPFKLVLLHILQSRQPELGENGNFEFNGYRVQIDTEGNVPSKENAPRTFRTTIWTSVTYCNGTTAAVLI